MPFLNEWRAERKEFREEIIFVAPERSEAPAISFWDIREDAVAYQRTSVPEALKIMSKVVDGTPKIDSFEVSYPTFEKIAAKGV